MKCWLLIVLTLTAKVVQAKNFKCKGEYSSSLCTISDVGPGDNNVDLDNYKNRRYQTITQLTILNSTMDDIPSISSQSSLSLHYLNCIGCGLADITKHSFTPLSQLESLNISYGSFTKLQKNLFSQLPSLINLNVSHGAITQIDGAAFFNLGTLQELDLSHNSISKITSNTFSSADEFVEVKFVIQSSRYHTQ
ncbi:hypothetical protein HA402_014443 [Bradysia odoriphaga]|nr:hypothetical protein HA402_014443 [Bradysia odoriphaga]